MKVFGIAGWSGCGKTTLVLRLLPIFTGRGLRVATIKHSHHLPELGNAETQALARAGAVESMVAGPDGFAVIHPVPTAPEPSLGQLAARVDPSTDLLLVEGFKSERHQKLEVWDPGLGKPLLAADDDTVVAVACDLPIPGLGRPVFRRDEVVALADFILAYCGLRGG